MPFLCRPKLLIAEFIASLSKVKVSLDDVELLECCCLDDDCDCEDVDGRLESSNALNSSKMSNECFLRPNVLIAVEMASFSTVNSSVATKKLLVLSRSLKEILI